MSDDTLNLEFLGRQQTAILTEMRDMRGEMRDIREEMRDMRKDFALAYRQVTDSQIGIMRTLQALDRRVSETKDELETTIKMELVGHRHSSDDKIEKALSEFEQHLVERFDARYAKHEDA